MNIITQHFTLIEPGPVQRLGGLTFFPLTVEGKSCPPSLQTFDQLADQGYAGAFEHGVDGSVTSVNIENNSPFFLLMLDGEGIVGAKQNRMVQRSVIIAPNTCQPIPVNCVEEGRWRYSGGAHFKKASFASSAKMRDVKAEYMKSGRDSYIQSTMWNEISALEEKLGVLSSTKDLDEILHAKQTVSSCQIQEFVQDNPCNGFLVFGSGRPFVELFCNKKLCEHFVTKSIKTWIADVDEEPFENNFNPYRALNQLLMSSWSADECVGAEKVYTSNDKNSGRCILLNGAFVHGYYYLPSQVYHTSPTLKV